MSSIRPICKCRCPPLLACDDVEIYWSCPLIENNKMSHTCNYSMYLLYKQRTYLPWRISLNCILSFFATTLLTEDRPSHDDEFPTVVSPNVFPRTIRSLYFPSLGRCNPTLDSMQSVVNHNSYSQGGLNYTHLTRQIILHQECPA